MEKKSFKREFISRYFNQLKVDATGRSITKSSTNREKLRWEYFWYTHLPDELKEFAAHPLQYREEGECAHLRMTFYPFPSLGDLYTREESRELDWEGILQRIIQIRSLSDKLRGQLPYGSFRHFLQTKLIKRLRMTWSKCEEMKRLMEEPVLVINGKRCKNLRSFIKDSGKMIRSVRTSECGLMHGDFILSNILYNVQTGEVRLVDPRGGMNEAGMYGSGLYDLAKLRSSVVDGYEFIARDLLKMRQDGNIFELENKGIFGTEYGSKFFDQLMEIADFEKIKLLEAWVFLSNIPLHAESIGRQKMFYVKGVQIMNELFG